MKAKKIINTTNKISKHKHKQYSKLTLNTPNQYLRLLPPLYHSKLLLFYYTLVCCAFIFSYINTIHCSKLLLAFKYNDSHHHQIYKRSSQQVEPSFVESLENVTVPIGRDAQFTCKVSNLGTHKPAKLTIKKTAWLRVEDKGILSIGDKLISRNSRHLLVPDSTNTSFTLIIRNVQPNDVGGYMCQINVSPMTFVVGYLDVLTPPMFVDDDDNKDTANQLPSLVEGENATLTCHATGKPEPQISWRREDGAPMLINGKLVSSVDNEPQLRLASVSRTHNGAYLCIADNKVQPAASKRLVLDVRYSPSVQVLKGEFEVSLNKDARLECIVDANPQASVAWLRQLKQVALYNGEHPAKLISGEFSKNAPPPNKAAAVAELDEEAHELQTSDKHDIVIKKISDGKTLLVLSVRKVSRSDLGAYRCVAQNSLGTQSLSVQLNERSASFFGSMFGSSSSSSSSSSANTNANQDATGQFAQGISRNATKNNALAHDSRQAPWRLATKNEKFTSAVSLASGKSRMTSPSVIPSPIPDASRASAASSLRLSFSVFSLMTSLVLIRLYAISFR